jgi:RNA polymerase sigma factor (TIGR02999 family)
MTTSPPERRAGDSGASAEVTERFYTELRAIAARLFASERRGHTLQPTSVVNEACLRIFTSSPLPEVPRAERLALAARVLEQVLVDHERARSAAKRGGRSLRIELDPELACAEEPLVDFERVERAIRRLRELSARQAEVVALRVFGGLTMEQVASALAISKRTAEADWTVARAWLRRELADEARPSARGDS